MTLTLIRNPRKFRTITCEDCGIKIETNVSKIKRCEICRPAYRKRYSQEYKRKYLWSSTPNGKAYAKKYHKEESLKYKAIVFDHYGWKCNCCGETLRTMLCVDHVNNDGHMDRKSYITGTRFYKKIIESGFSNNYQILCANCNWSKKINKGICEHKILK